MLACIERRFCRGVVGVGVGQIDNDFNFGIRKDFFEGLISVDVIVIAKCFCAVFSYVEYTF